jgi:hypothetical protein
MDLEGSAAVLGEEDEATLAAIDRGIKATEEGRVVSIYKSSSRKTP